ncbi:TATA-box-binding protein [Culex quinquefasciatus]|uniref:TATA-box-binding protein n=1 Tax=Culex quinquefasciatus TaxID=7176 RepID=UPI0018E3789E|nr:TATA-box-binding protein [Culex quinquefasciatus]
MYCSNQSSMATLLQQKSFMKNLTNGANNVVVVNGTDDSATTNPAVATVASGGSVASRMLLPHETMTMLSPAGSTTLIHQQPLIHQQTVPVTTAASFNSQFINHLQSNHHLAFGGSSTTVANPTTSIQSQFHNAYVDVNSIFNRSTSAATTISNSSSSFAMASPHHHHLPHLVSNASSLVYANGTTHPAAAAASKHHHHHHQQQTVPESQTANSATSGGDAVKSEPSDGDSRLANQQTPATATATEDDDKTAVEPVECKDEEPEPEIDIVINNVVCSFSVRCHLNLRDIAQKGFNVEFRRENGMVTMKLRRPYTTASIWSSGKITCTGATSEDSAKVAARRYSRCLQKLGFNVRFRNFRIVNVLGTCSMPWGIMIVNFSEKYKKDASYEPELHPGVTYKLYNPKATLKIFSTGSITVTAASVAFVQSAIEHIFPLVYEFRKKRTPAEKIELLKPPEFDPEALIEEECDITDATSAASFVGATVAGGEVGDDEDCFDGSTGTDTKAINHHARRSNRKCASRYSSTRVGRRRPAGKADNDPTEDAMYVSDDDDDDEDDDMIESD